MIRKRGTFIPHAMTYMIRDNGDLSLRGDYTSASSIIFHIQRPEEFI